MGEPQYRLEGIVHTRTEQMEDFEGPLDVIFLLLSKNKIEALRNAAKDIPKAVTDITIMQRTRKTICRKEKNDGIIHAVVYIPPISAANTVLNHRCGCPNNLLLPTIKRKSIKKLKKLVSDKINK